jgi:hypothetical protein
VPLGVMATKAGLVPTLIGVPITVFVVMSMTETVLPGVGRGWPLA